MRMEVKGLEEVGPPIRRQDLSVTLASPEKQPQHRVPPRNAIAN